MASAPLRQENAHMAGMNSLDALLEDELRDVYDAERQVFEITAYGSLVAWATTLGHRPVVKLLQANLDEEEAADVKLSAIAESGLNQLAARADDAPSARAQARSAGR